ncbi:MAG TPA: hypothetical protein VKK81_10640 [Candidatus Binatia bacterium]|nr:hypothetical protein [Candidatus Binatia bacterium]
MTTTTLRPWTDLVKLHPDVESGALTEAVFAIDLGAIAAKCFVSEIFVGLRR